MFADQQNFSLSNKYKPTDNWLFHLTQLWRSLTCSKAGRAFRDLHKTVSWTASLASAGSWALHHKVIWRNGILPPLTRCGPFSKAEAVVICGTGTHWAWVTLIKPLSSAQRKAAVLPLKTVSELLHIRELIQGVHIISPLLLPRACCAQLCSHHAPQTRAEIALVETPWALGKSCGTHLPHPKAPSTTEGPLSAKKEMRFNKGNKATRCCIWRQRI